MSERRVIGKKLQRNRKQVVEELVGHSKDTALYSEMEEPLKVLR